jgi:hypothetical protein
MEMKKNSFNTGSDLPAGSNSRQNGGFRRFQGIISNLNKASGSPLWNYAKHRHGNSHPFRQVIYGRKSSTLTSKLQHRFFFVKRFFKKTSRKLANS